MFLAPLMIAAAMLVLSGSSGPVTVRRPYVLGDGRIVYLNEFRTYLRFDANAVGDPLVHRTAIGRVLHETRLALLPRLRDVMAGRIGLATAVSL